VLESVPTKQFHKPLKSTNETRVLCLVIEIITSLLLGQPGYQAIHLGAENTISGLFRDSL